MYSLLFSESEQRLFKALQSCSKCMICSSWENIVDQAAVTTNIQVTVKLVVGDLLFEMHCINEWVLSSGCFCIRHKKVEQIKDQV